MVDTAKLNQILDPLDLFGGQANRLAGDIQEELAGIGLDLERDFFQQLREDEAPVRDVRNAALQFLQQIQTGEAQLPQDPSLPFQIDQGVTDIGQAAAARGKFFSGGRQVAEQDVRAQLTGQDTSQQLNRLLNLSGFETQDLLNSNSLIAQNTDAIANQQSNVNAVNRASRVGQSNQIFNILGQGSQLAGALL